MNKIRISIILLLSIFILGIGTKSFGQALTGDEIDQLIKKMVDARLRHQFMGDLMIKRFGNKQPRIFRKRIWVDSPNRIRDEIIFPDKKKPIIRIRNEDDFETIVDGRSILSRQRRHFKPRFPFLKRIEENYDFNIVDGGIIAGRETKLIVVKPKLKDRTNFKYWIDKETEIVLKKEVLRLKGENLIPIYEKSFTNIDYKPPKRPDLFRIKREEVKRTQVPSWKTEEYETIEQARKSIKFPFITPVNLPEGYQLDRIRITKERKNTTIHLNYTNGITSFSIFQTRGTIPLNFRRIFREENKSVDDILEIERENRTIFFRKVGLFNMTLIGNCSKELLIPVIKNISSKHNP